MADPFAIQIARAVAAVQIGPGSGYSWLGERIDLPAPLVGLGAPEAVREALVQGAARRLYGDFFSSGAPRRAVRAEATPDRRRLSERLAAANSGRGCLDAGWRWVRIDHDRVVVERDGLRLWVRPEDVVRDPEDGSRASVRLAPDAPFFSPGYYMALGDRGLDLDSPRRLDRFYLHLEPEGAEACVRRATERLNAAGLSFRLKVVDDPDGFRRCDSAILAFQRKDRDRSLPEVLDLAGHLAANLHPAIPAMTRWIAPGAAFAEDPGGGESFGADRARLIAEALVTAHEAGATSVEDRVALVRERFHDAGTSIEAPYLGPDSPGDLELMPPVGDHAEEQTPCL